MNEEQMQELDRILKLWSDSYHNQINSENLGCLHESKTYIGFSEEYEFCVKCDAKKIEGQWITSSPWTPVAAPR